MFKRKRRVKDYKIKSEFDEGANITQQKGQRKPLQLQQAVDKENKNPLEAGHIKKIEKITDKMFIQAVVITIKKERSFKIALNIRSHYNVIWKNKISKNLMEKVAEKFNSEERRRSLVQVPGYVVLNGIDLHVDDQSYAQTQQNIAN